MRLEQIVHRYLKARAAINGESLLFVPGTRRIAFDFAHAARVQMKAPSTIAYLRTGHRIARA
eukprot:2859904-Rhodomonas_salina.1